MTGKVLVRIGGSVSGEPEKNHDVAQHEESPCDARPPLAGGRTDRGGSYVLDPPPN